MLGDWNRILEDNEIEPTFYPRQRREPRNVSFYCDESEVSTSRGSVFLLALAAIEEPAAVREATAKVTRSYLADPFMTGRRDDVRARGLHYSEATEELRTEYVRALADCPFRAYVAMDFLVKHESVRVAFLFLLNALLKDRLTACDRALVHFHFENNDSLSPTEIKAAVSSTYAILTVADSRRPLSQPDVST
jgi:RNA-directed DNA polymerase